MHAKPAAVGNPQPIPAPADVAKLRKALKAGAFTGRDLKFASDLVTRHDAGRLTLGMVPWIGRLAARLDAPATAELPSVEGVVALLSRAQDSGLKHPKLWLQFPDGAPLRIKVAGGKSSTPGYLMLTDGEAFGSNKYFGRISPAGALEIGRDGFAIHGALINLLTDLSADPVKIAGDFGHLTGHCCFCALPLTDERSVSVGYGSTCAEKFALPWGARPKEATPKRASKKVARAEHGAPGR